MGCSSEVAGQYTQRQVQQLAIAAAGAMGIGQTNSQAAAAAQLATHPDSTRVERLETELARLSVRVAELERSLSSVYPK
jgi:uncharacterized protein (DUF3084 family)